MIAVAEAGISISRPPFCFFWKGVIDNAVKLARKKHIQSFPPPGAHKRKEEKKRKIERKKGRKKEKERKEKDIPAAPPSALLSSPHSTLFSLSPRTTTHHHVLPNPKRRPSSKKKLRTRDMKNMPKGNQFFHERGGKWGDSRPIFCDIMWEKVMGDGERNGDFVGMG